MNRRLENSLSAIFIIIGHIFYSFIGIGAMFFTLCIAIKYRLKILGVMSFFEIIYQFLFFASAYPAVSTWMFNAVPFSAADKQFALAINAILYSPPWLPLTYAFSVNFAVVGAWIFLFRPIWQYINRELKKYF